MARNTSVTIGDHFTSLSAIRCEQAAMVQPAMSCAQDFGCWKSMNHGTGAAEWSDRRGTASNSCFRVEIAQGGMVSRKRS